MDSDAILKFAHLRSTAEWILNSAIEYAMSELLYINPSVKMSVLVYVYVSGDTETIDMLAIHTNGDRTENGEVDMEAVLSNVGADTRPVHDMLRSHSSGYVSAVLFLPEDDPQYQTIRNGVEADLATGRNSHLFQSLRRVAEHYGHRPFFFGHGFQRGNELIMGYLFPAHVLPRDEYPSGK